MNEVEQQDLHADLTKEVRYCVSQKATPEVVEFVLSMLGKCSYEAFETFERLSICIGINGRGTGDELLPEDSAIAAAVRKVVNEVKEEFLKGTK
jgi:hypothetical protein